jgi:CHAT domain-containing protein
MTGLLNLNAAAAFARRALRLGMVAGLAMLASGCAYYAATGTNRALMDSHYSEITHNFEPQFAAGRPIPTEDLYPLCSAYQKLKTYDKFFACVDRLQANIDAGDTSWSLNDISTGPSLLRASTYIELSDYPAAIKEANTAIAIIDKKDLHRAFRIEALSSLCLADALSGEAAAARKCIDELDAIGTFYPFNLLDTPKKLGEARAYMALHDYQKALDAARSSASAMAPLADLMTGAALTGDSMFRYVDLPRVFMVNKALFETGKLAEARQGYLQLLAADGTKDNGEIYQVILYDLGRAAESEGKADEAASYYRQSIDVIERQRATINSMANKIGFVGDKQQVYASLIALLAARGQVDTAFEYSERAKSRALVDLLASRAGLAQAAAAPDAARLLGDLRQVEEQISSEDVGATSAKVRALSLRKSEIQSEIAKTAPELSALVTVSALSSRGIQALLAPDETLVEYFQSGSTLIAFVATRTALSAVKLDGTDLAGAVERLRDQLMDPRQGGYKAASAEAYARLVAPLAAQIKTPKLIVVPHGALHYVPFAALGDSNGLLVDRWTLRYMPSASAMRYLRSRSAAANQAILAFGNPDLGNPQYALKFAQREAEQIAASVPGSRLLTGRAADKAAFVRLAPDYSYLHMATHGLFDALQPLNSGIFLAGPDPRAGELTVGEIYRLKLNADLITLSACETGLGKVSNGDDVIGLTQGFLYAGTRSIVASLWPVDDEGTLFLMTTFYQKLKSAPPAEALRQAQMAAKQKYPHPFYWAAFGLTGGG